MTLLSTDKIIFSVLFALRDFLFLLRGKMQKRFGGKRTSFKPITQADRQAMKRTNTFHEKIRQVMIEKGLTLTEAKDLVLGRHIETLEEIVQRKEKEERAKERRLLFKNGSSKPFIPRKLRDKPNETKQYCPEMSSYFDDNQRLTMGARTCLRKILTFCGSDNEILTNISGLSEAIGVSYRTVQRYIRELKREGAILAFTRKNKITGMYCGLYVVLKKKVRPYFFNDENAQKGQKSSNDTKGTMAKKFTESSTGVSPFKQVNIYKRKKEQKSLSDLMPDLNLPLKT